MFELVNGHRDGAGLVTDKTRGNVGEYGGVRITCPTCQRQSAYRHDRVPSPGDVEHITGFCLDVADRTARAKQAHALLPARNHLSIISASSNLACVCPAQ